VTKWRLTAAARADLRAILRTSRRRFGPDQALRYADLFHHAAGLAADTPQRPGSRDCGHVGIDVRSMHLGVAAGRLRSASHVILYRTIARSGTAIEILRVLHERMDPARHVGDAE
jgi:plasmid stabilization system protein ParE